MNASADREDRARAVLDAATAAQWWANAVRAQQQATPSHTDFYALAAQNCFYCSCDQRNVQLQ